MSDHADVIGKIAGAICFAGYIPYLRAILRGDTRPNRATWGIYTIVDALLVWSYVSVGGTNAIWVSVGYLVGAGVTFALSIKRGVGGWSTLDQICIAGSAASLALWWGFGSPFVALLANVAVMIIGTLPTLVKAFREPWTEDRLTWTMFFTGTVVNLFALERLDFKINLLPVMNVVLGVPMMLALYRPWKRPVAV